MGQGDYEKKITLTKSYVGQFHKNSPILKEKFINRFILLLHSRYVDRFAHKPQDLSNINFNGYGKGFYFSI